MDNLNLLENIEETQTNFNNIFKDDSYLKYLSILDRYHGESVKNSFNNEFNYFVDENGNYVKEAYNKKNEKDNILIVKPTYIIIKKRLDELNDIIYESELKLKNYRSSMLKNDLSVKVKFSEELDNYNKLIKEKTDILQYKNNNENKEEIKKIKLSNIEMNLEQNKLLKESKNYKDLLDLDNYYQSIKSYLLNNEAINNNLSNINKLKKNLTKNFIISKIEKNDNLSQNYKKFFKKSSKSKNVSLEEDVENGLPEVDLEVEIEGEGDNKLNIEEIGLSGIELQNEDEHTDLPISKEVEIEGDGDNTLNIEEIDLSGIELQNEDEPTGLPTSKEVEIEGDGDNTLNIEEIELQNEDEHTDLPTSKEDMDIQTLDLGDDLEELAEIGGDDEDQHDENVIFNKMVNPQLKEEDTNIPLLLAKSDEGEEATGEEATGEEINLYEEIEKSQKKLKPKVKSKPIIEDDEDLDLELLSKKLNKKVKDPNIKIISVDPNLQFSSLKTCDDSKTKRSEIETTKIADGKTRRKKWIDPELKKCIFPFKEIKGRGKKKKETIHNKCVENDGLAPWCATERNADCTMKVGAYCKDKK